MVASATKKDKQLNIETIKHGKLTWINIEKPTARETEYLAQNYPFHPLDLDDCVSRIQRPKIDKYETYLFIVLHFPVYNKEARVTTASQVSIFIGEDYLITLHTGALKPLAKLFVDCKANENARSEYMRRSSSYLLYLILDRLINSCFPILYKIVDNIENVEDDIFAEGKRETVKELSILRRDVIAFRRIIKPQTEVFELLENEDWPVIKVDPEVYFGDIADHARKIQDTLDDYKEVVEGLNDTNNTLYSFRTNQVIRVLTIISTIMLPLALIASILGMNVRPLTSDGPSWSTFVVIIVVMVGIAIGMLALFRRKRWI
ncbi:magnesium/cobalt transporter CorA [Chloroflexota bacterium]